MDLRGLALRDLPHVYPLREDSWLLAASVEVHRGETVLEVGCGRGLASLAAARAGGKVVASDRNPFALQGVRSAAHDLGLHLALVRCDLMSGLRTFDVIMFNPPYLRTRPEEQDPDPWVDLALDGGPDGLATIRRFLAQLPDHLACRGRAYLLQAAFPGGSFPELPLRGLKLLRVAGTRELPAERLRVLELTAAAAEGTTGGPEPPHSPRNLTP